MEGTPFGRYRLLELIGRGGMGEVWRAYDTATDRMVAVKVLPANLLDDQTFEQRFRREANAAAALNEPHVVPIHNFGEIEGRLYVDMRLIDGRDLQSLLSDGALSPARAVKVVEQVAAALYAAHRVGLVHRDVKPSNILVAEFDFAYLIDFGIARTVDEKGLTNTGSVIGTWAYMAPERFSTGRTDPRSDTYALACVLHECLTGRQPYPGNSVEQQIAAHLTTPPPLPSTTQPGVSPAFDTVIATGMAKEPEQRYRTTLELANAARSAVETPATRPAPRVRPAWPTQPVQPNQLPAARPPATPPPTWRPSPLAATHLAGVGRPDPDTSAAQPVSTGGVSRRSRRAMIAIAAVVAAIVLVGAAIFATVQFGREPDDRRGDPPPPIDPEPTLPADPPLKAAALERVLLSIGRLNEIVGSTAMTITSDLTTMTDHSADVSDRECLGAMYGAETPVYAKSGWTAVRDQVAREPGENDHWVEQTAVLYPSAEHAENFFSESRAQLESCGGRTNSVRDETSTYVWQIEAIKVLDDLIVQRTAQQDASGWACQHALAVVSNLTVETWACGYSIRDEGATIATEIVENAARAS